MFSRFLSSGGAGGKLPPQTLDSGVLGLAYVAKRGRVGGICEKRLNTGIVTILNYNQRVHTPVTVLTLAHQAGHSFGSEV